MRRRVLIATDVQEFAAAFVLGYSQAGFDVITGAGNFLHEACDVDILHINWPEEYSGWRLPSEAALSEIERRVVRWSKRATIIFTVNNLFPHRDYGHETWRRLYSIFYHHASLVHHMSQTSLDSVKANYPEISRTNHFVRLGFNYDHLLRNCHRDRQVSRNRLGLKPHERVCLSFGSLRSWSEVCLLRDGFDAANTAGMRLIAGARYSEVDAAQGRLSGWVRRMRWRMWKRGAINLDNHVPDSELHHVFDAADVVVVVRQSGLTSGVPSLAMTFGKTVVGPDCGSIPEFLSGTGNIIYDRNDPRALGKAIDDAFLLDLEAVGRGNRKIADGWSWTAIIADCLGRLDVAATGYGTEKSREAR